MSHQRRPQNGPFQCSPGYSPGQAPPTLAYSGLAANGQALALYQRLGIHEWFWIDGDARSTTRMRLLT